MTSAPRVSVVVLNWNGLADTRECLESLKAVSYPDYRVIVIDNGSREDEARALQSAFGDFARVVRSETNRGFAGGANIGIREALSQGSDYVLLLNNDTTVDPSFLSALVEAAQTLPALAAACPKTFFYETPEGIYSTGGKFSLWRGVARQIGRGQRDRGQFERRERRGYADGVCMLIPASAIERVGLLDEEYFAYWEETDWCARAGHLGLSCYYVPGARIWHKAARSQAPDPEFHYRYRRNALLFVRKRGTGLQFLCALLMHLFGYAPLYFLRHPTKIRRAAAEARALLWHASNQPKERPLA